MLAREVLRLRGSIATRETEWDVMVDLYFYRDPEAEENKDGIEEAKGVDEVGTAAVDTGFANTGGDWEVTGNAATAFAGATAAAPAAGAADQNWGESTEWGAAATTTGGEWGAAETKPAESW